MEESRFRLRPRYQVMAYSAMAMGALLLAYGVAAGSERAALVIAMGIAGITLGLSYLASPVWRLTVVIGDAGMEVHDRRSMRFRVPWDEVENLIVCPKDKTCFVHAGVSARSLLVPGPGANARYDIENKHQLYEQLIARVPADRVIEVPERLSKWLKAERDRRTAEERAAAAGTGEPAEPVPAETPDDEAESP